MAVHRMILCDLPNELLLMVLEYLSSSAIATLARVCWHLHDLVNTDSLWSRLCRQEFGVESLVQWNVSSFQELYSRVLFPYRYLLGVWEGDLKYYGELMEARVDNGRILGQLWRASSSQNIDLPLYAEPLFAVEVSDKEVRTVCLYRDMKGKRATLKKCHSGSTELLEVQFKVMYDFTKTKVDSVSLRSWVREEYPPAFADIWENHGFLRQAFTNRYKSLQFRQQLVQYRPVALPPSLSSDFPLKPGIYKGTYSSHGIELILVTMEGSIVKGQKLTGDPNIPASKVTFQGLLQCPIPPDQYSSWGAAIFNHRQMLSEIRNQVDREEQEHSRRTNVESRQLTVTMLNSVPLQEHPFSVSLGFSGDLQTYPNVSLARFPSSGQVAGDGYVNPQWSLNQLVLFPSGNFAIVWMELRSVSFYCKAQEL
ncbi:F-box only protein 31-like [Corticium candelabrum]|uniref:F-box only protein 31-like n=1 Tax=Corticium candelabrum TaxID=121492 RepID=UPI002E26785D|nr:F-box only protein 31-like [Corticium candelabrum]